MPEVTRPVLVAVNRPGSSTETDPVPWAGGRVTFRLVGGSFTAEAQYPTAKVVLTLDAAGEGTAHLWPNELGEEASTWKCTLPDGDSFEFTLPLGDGSAIEVSALRLLGVTENDAQYATLLSTLTPIAETAAEDAAAASIASATAAASTATTAASSADTAAASANAAAARLSLAALIRSGRATVATNVLPPGLPIAYDGTLEEMRVYVGTAPVGSALTVVAKRLGVTLATASVAAGATSGSVTGLAVAVAVGDLITFDITAIGSTTPGSDVVVLLKGGS
jgi:hypothetical protein